MFQLHLQYSELPHNVNNFHAMVRVTPNSVIDEKLPPKSILYLLVVGVYLSAISLIIISNSISSNIGI